MGTSIRPVFAILPVIANAFVPGLDSVPMVQNHFAPFGDDGRNVCIGFNVVENGGHFEQTVFNGARGFGAGHAALAFDGSGQCGTFAANECACALVDMEIEIKAAAENVLAEQADFLCLFDCGAESEYRKGYSART